ncbi:MAG: hypothetical protein AAGA30_12940, partial [Planctomycetota bacterium]
NTEDQTSMESSGSYELIWWRKLDSILKIRKPLWRQLGELWRKSTKSFDIELVRVPFQENFTSLFSFRAWHIPTLRFSNSMTSINKKTQH